MGQFTHDLQTEVAAIRSLPFIIDLDQDRASQAQDSVICLNLFLFDKTVDLPPFFSVSLILPGSVFWGRVNWQKNALSHCLGFTAVLLSLVRSG